MKHFGELEPVRVTTSVHIPVTLDEKLRLSPRFHRKQRLFLEEVFLEVEVEFLGRPNPCDPSYRFRKLSIKVDDIHTLPIPKDDREYYSLWESYLNGWVREDLDYNIGYAVYETVDPNRVEGIPEWEARCAAERAEVEAKQRKESAKFVREVLALARLIQATGPVAIAKVHDEYIKKHPAMALHAFDALLRHAQGHGQIELTHDDRIVS